MLTTLEYRININGGGGDEIIGRLANVLKKMTTGGLEQTGGGGWKI